MPLLRVEELKGIPFAKQLMDLVKMTDMNELYDSVTAWEGPECADRILKGIGVNYEVGHPEVLAQLAEGPFITVSNHAYGHIDGIAMVDLFGHVRPDYKFLVNKILARVETLGPNFITVIPTGEERSSAQPESVKGIMTAFKHVKEGHPLGLFPAGAVSNLSIRDGFRIRDREWQEAIIKVIKKARVPVLPVRFFDRNSLFYYLLGLISWKIRVVRLPAEMFNKAGRRMRIGLGNIISVEQQDAVKDLDAFRTMLRNSVYDMQIPDDFVPRNEIFH